MQISKVSNNISFKKRLVATCKVKNESGDNLDCKIYQLDSKKDKNYFKKLEKDSNWDEAKYLDDMDDELRYCIKMDAFDTNSFFTLENQNGECLGYSELFHTDKKFSVDILETNPKYRFGKEKRNLKYVGETLLSFLANIAKKMNINDFSLTATTNACKFYTEKCFFKKDNSAEWGIKFLRLPPKNYDKLIQQNEAHCGEAIEIIG